MKNLPAQALCPCGRTDAKRQPLRYAQCCGMWLETGALAPDAHALMRSRYSAFVLEREDYLLRTWHASTRPSAVEFESDVKWLGLEVRHFTHDTVEFVARQRKAGSPALRLHECSRFVQEAGAWLYLDAAATPH